MRLNEANQAVFLFQAVLMKNVNLSQILQYIVASCDMDSAR